MATAFYVYSDMNMYNRINKGFTDDPIRHAILIDLFILDYDHIIVLTNTNNLKERPNLKRTIIHVRNGVLSDELKAKSKCVLYKKITFDAKHNNLLFFPRFLRKPLYKTRVDRYFGDISTKKHIINYEHRFYDFVRDRISLVIS